MQKDPITESRVSSMIYNCLAKALYENCAESPDELSFKRGDVVTVLEQNTNGLEGWWLCSLRGKQGIAPGNRLKILAGMYDTGGGTGKNSHYATLPSGGQKHQQIVDNVDEPQWNRRSWDIMPDKVLKPSKVGNIYVYDQPGKNAQDYDVPPTRYFPTASITPSHTSRADLQGNYDILPSNRKSCDNDWTDSSSYDTPQSSKNTSQYSISHDSSVYDTPPSHSYNGESPYQVPKSNRSSVVSMLSTGSTAMSSSSSGRSNPASMCGSTRSSGDISLDIYDIPPSVVKKSSSESMLDIYDIPPDPKPVEDSNTLKSCKSRLTYDNDGTLTKNSQVKFDPRNVDYDIPTSKPVLDSKRSLKIEDCAEYDIPRSAKKKDMPSLPKKSREDHVYDVPPLVSRDSAVSTMSNTSSDSIDERMSSLSLNSFSRESRNSSIVSNALALAESVLSEAAKTSGAIVIDAPQLDLDLDTAMAELVKRETELHAATSKLLSHVKTNWRSQQNITTNLNDVKVACMFVKTALYDFVNLSQGALANASVSSDTSLVQKLQNEIVPLQESQAVIVRSMKCLKDAKWNVTILVENTKGIDPLGDIVSVTKHLSDIVRKVSICIRGNSTLLFIKKDLTSRPLPTPPGKDNQRSSGDPKPQVKPKPVLSSITSPQQRPLPSPPKVIRPLPSPPGCSDLQMTPERLSPDRSISNHELHHVLEDYDYVQLETSDITEQKNQEADTDCLLTPKQKAQIDLIEKQLKQDILGDLNDFVLQDNTGSRTTLIPNDKRVLVFYSEQTITHSEILTNAIDVFLGGIEYNQPPKVFVAHSKFVVIAAHKLVYISDTLNRNIAHNDIRNKVTHCANTLCDALKQCVVSTKNAALQYPSVLAVQDMIDRVVDISHAASELKLVITQASTL